MTLMFFSDEDNEKLATCLSVRNRLAVNGTNLFLRSSTMLPRNKLVRLSKARFFASLTFVSKAADYPSGVPS